MPVGHVGAGGTTTDATADALGEVVAEPVDPLCDMMKAAVPIPTTTTAAPMPNPTAAMGVLGGAGSGDPVANPGVVPLVGWPLSGALPVIGAGEVEMGTEPVELVKSLDPGLVNRELCIDRVGSRPTDSRSAFQNSPALW